MAELDVQDLTQRLQGEARDLWIHIETEGRLEKYPAKQHARSVAARLNVDAGLIYLPGTQTQYLEDSDQPIPFRQRRYFYYLSGVDERDCHLTYDIGSDRLTLFVPAIDPKRVIWTGHGSTKEEAYERYDVDCVAYSGSVQEVVQEWMGRCREGKVYVLHPSQTATPGDEKLERVDTSKLVGAIDACRVIKDEHEIELIRRANQVTAEAHKAVLKNINKFESEAQVEGLFLDTCVAEGAKRQAYDPIAASGENAATLHYTKNDESLQGRQLMVLDAGCEWECYASDVTRTFPLAGDWPSKESKNIYELVLKMQMACIERLKPGVRFLELHHLAHQIAIKGLLELGVLRGGSVDDIVTAGTSLAFFPHGLGHHVGLEVHDVSGVPINSLEKSQEQRLMPTSMLCGAAAQALLAAGELEEGMVLTVEPGIYFSRFALENYLKNEEHAKFIDKDVVQKYIPVGGVRIEDNLLITSKGYENLTTAPKGEEMLRLIRSEELGQKDEKVSGKLTLSVKEQALRYRRSAPKKCAVSPAPRQKPQQLELESERSCKDAIERSQQRYDFELGCYRRNAALTAAACTSCRLRKLQCSVDTASKSCLNCRQLGLLDCDEGFGAALARAPRFYAQYKINGRISAPLPPDRMLLRQGPAGNADLASDDLSHSLEEAKTDAQAPMHGARNLVPVNLDTQCGVPSACGLLCSNQLNCESHTMHMKRTVRGRSAPLDQLLDQIEQEKRLEVPHKALDAPSETVSVAARPQPAVAPSSSSDTLIAQHGANHTQRIEEYYMRQGPPTVPKKTPELPQKPLAYRHGLTTSRPSSYATLYNDSLDDRTTHRPHCSLNWLPRRSGSSLSTGSCDACGRAGIYTCFHDRSPHINPTRSSIPGNELYSRSSATSILPPPRPIEADIKPRLAAVITTYLNAIPDNRRMNITGDEICRMLEGNPPFHHLNAYLRSLGIIFEVDALRKTITDADPSVDLASLGSLKPVTARFPYKPYGFWAQSTYRYTTDNSNTNNNTKTNNSDVTRAPPHADIGLDLGDPFANPAARQLLRRRRSELIHRQRPAPYAQPLARAATQRKEREGLEQLCEEARELEEGLGVRRAQSMMFSPGLYQ
ncbi:hypothetical protein LTS18_006201 [Coniosporium uncinatum]|uniref:Uncharacterized protein n=1 Tax=Coniosporium uncinatum TaxID=93489 RepID=A0ACC3DD82_9PEZI|nr:hypothetical protein LTS18_006201 [Coniosporium uncinatum]